MGKDWRHVSPDAKSLISQLMKVSPKKLCTPQRALNHDWIAHKAPGAKDVPLTEGLLNKLSNFRLQSKFKKAVLQIIAGQLDNDQTQHFRDLFLAIDKNDDGLLTLDELKSGLTC